MGPASIEDIAKYVSSASLRLLNFMQIHGPYSIHWEIFEPQFNLYECQPPCLRDFWLFFFGGVQFADKLWMLKAPRDPTETTFSNLKKLFLNLVSFFMTPWICVWPEVTLFVFVLPENAVFVWTECKDEHVINLANEVRRILSKSEQLSN